LDIVTVQQLFLRVRGLCRVCIIPGILHTHFHLSMYHSYQKDKRAKPEILQTSS